MSNPLWNDQPDEDVEFIDVSHLLPKKGFKGEPHFFQCTCGGHLTDVENN